MDDPAQSESQSPSAEPPALPPALPPARNGFEDRSATRLHPVHPGRRLRIFLVAAAVGTLAAVVAIAVSMLIEGPTRVSPWPAADEFVTWLKLGEEPDPNRPDDDRFGYALAHDLFTERLQSEIPWIDFYQGWVRLTRQQGDVMSSERITPRRRRGQRGRRRFTFRLRLGYPSEQHEDMRAFVLEFSLVRREDSFRVERYKFVPSDGLR